MMLVVPYTLFATYGVMTIGNRITSHKLLAITFLSIYATTSILYMVSPSVNPISTYAVLWPSTKYSPATMLRQRTPIEDTPFIEQAFNWLNENMESNACLLTRETFLDWARICLKKNATIIDYWTKDVSIGLQYAKMLNYSDIYWIWLDEKLGMMWYGQKTPSEFKLVSKMGDILIYKYTI
jgi:hypothetical protein